MEDPSLDLVVALVAVDEDSLALLLKVMIQPALSDLFAAVGAGD